MVLFKNRASEVLYDVLINIKQKKFLLPLNICPIVPETFLKAKKEFVFIDISLDDLCMNRDLVFEKLKEDKDIDGVLFVKTFGIELDVESFYKKIKKLDRDMFIVDDECLCIPKFDCKIENSYADLKLFSSGYSKYVDIGYGGYGFLKDNDFLNIFKDKSQNKNFLKYKKKIEKQLPLMDRHKKKINKIYSKNLPKEIFLGKEFNRWRFSLLVNNKDKILKEIFDIDGLFASSHYPQIDYKYVTNPIKDSNTKRVHSQIINLFNDFKFTKEKAHQIVDIINKNIRKQI